MHVIVIDSSTTGGTERLAEILEDGTVIIISDRGDGTASGNITCEIENFAEPEEWCCFDYPEPYPAPVPARPYVSAAGVDNFAYMPKIPP